MNFQERARAQVQVNHCDDSPSSDNTQSDDIPQIGSEVEDGDEFVVEEIVAHRNRNGRTEYLTSWLGYPESENTWEDEDNFIDDGVVNAELTRYIRNRNRRAPFVLI